MTMLADISNLPAPTFAGLTQFCIWGIIILQVAHLVKSFRGDWIIKQRSSNGGAPATLSMVNGLRSEIRDSIASLRAERQKDFALFKAELMSNGLGQELPSSVKDFQVLIVDDDRDDRVLVMNQL